MSRGFYEGDCTQKEYTGGETVFLVESNIHIRKVVAVKKTGDFYTVRFEGDGGIGVRGSRLFPMKEDAESSLPKRGKTIKTLPYDYPH